MSYFVLEDSEREVLQKKAMPFILIGTIIWMVGQLFFSYLFTNTALAADFWIYYIALICVDIMLFIFVYLTARNQKNTLGVVIYFVFAFLVGMLSVPIILITGELRLYLYAMFSLGVGGAIIVFLISAIMGDKYFAEGYFGFLISLFFIFIVIMEVLLIFILPITSFYTILISVFLLLYTTASIMFCSVSAAKRIKDEYWLLWVLQIIFFIALIMMYVFIIIMIIASAVLSYGLDSGGGSDYGLRRDKNKQKKEIHK